MSIIQPKKLLSVPSGFLRIPRLPQQADVSNQSILFSLVIPTYLEAGNINKIVRTLTSLLDESIPGDYELIVVDDNSPDGTWEAAFSMMSELPQLRVMRRENERGLSSAVIRGWQSARGRVLGVIDGDLQHPPHILLQLLKAIEKYDLAVASRHIEGGGVSSWSFMRRLLSRGAQLLGLIILPRVIGRVSDPMSGYFMVRRNCVENITFNPIGYKILLEVLGRGRVNKIVEIGYVFCERQDGESKVSWKHYLDYIRHLLRLRFSVETEEKLSQSRGFPIGRFIRFGLVGLSGVFVDMTILYLLSDPNTLALPLTRSKIIAGEIAIFNNFLWNDAWTFADVAMQQKGLKQRLKRFLKFNIICLAGLVINVLVLNLIFNFVISNRYIANLIAIAVATVWNFWVNLKLSWRVTQVK
ncbi:glycosyltransferase [Plectonema cf. radiosum LEGE 06105]|uniref:Dolichol-phosphate mannosyltransferase n=1 Tax=Plectonema cf. radiosum LEGE 06105 TaxID=945769 RepID=A0A8J7F560_9CYAN|nr:glycosyltransferase [Plectonema radiosum]MBE9211399.1 glycosyltransferase [Plectonema cf. radiosum LEGE 06105]